MNRNTTRAEPGKRAPTAQDRAGPLFVQSVEKALNVLSAFHHADGPLTLSDIAERAAIDRSAAQRMVHTLRALSYVERDVDGHGFVPGVRAFVPMMAGVLGMGASRFYVANVSSALASSTSSP